MLYKIRAYTSKANGQSGAMPVTRFETGNWQTAAHGANAAAQDYGAAVVENTETGERTWFERK